MHSSIPAPFVSLSATWTRIPTLASAEPGSSALVANGNPPPALFLASGTHLWFSPDSLPAIRSRASSAPSTEPGPAPISKQNVDWVPGAFSIMRREALSKAGVFDPRFFLYCEEVDLCRRIKAEGFRVLYWPDVVVTHIGGESGRQLTGHHFSESQVRVELWQMRSTLIYFRKHHGFRVWGVRWLEDTLQVLRWLRNRWSSNPDRRPRADEARLFLKLMRQAWRETNGGRISPTRPW